MKKTCLVTAAIVLTAWVSFGAELRLVAPNGGEEICLGRPFRIVWAASGVNEKVKLQLIRSGGALVGQIVANLNAGDLSFSWPLAGNYNGGTAPEGANYKIRLVAMDGSGTLFDESDAAFSLKQCGASGLQPVSQVHEFKPKNSFDPTELSPADSQRAPKLQIRDFTYNYRMGFLEAWVKNVGNAPFVGHFRWQWVTECGIREANKDIPPSQSAILETSTGMPFHFECDPAPGACSMHASFSIEPMESDGTRLESSLLQKDFSCFEHSQFLMSERRLLLRFLHGSHWVNCSQQYVITDQDAFDYNPDTKIATFSVGFPVKNCGSLAGQSDHIDSQKLYWSVYHSPSNSYTLHPKTVSNGWSYSSSPLDPGQGILVERALSLPVRSGIYMLHVRFGSAPANECCVIQLSFADNLIH